MQGRRPESLIQSLFVTQVSLSCHGQLYKLTRRRRIEQLTLCGSKDFISPHPNVIVNSLCLDNIDGNFLLTGGYNGCIGLYDFSQYEVERQQDTFPSSSGFSSSNMSHKSRSATKPRRELYNPINISNHQRTMISCLQWYTLDCGLFLSSDMAGNAVVYDTESFSPVSQTNFAQQKVYHARFHPSVHRSTLVACALDDGSVRLWDMLSQDSLQTISAHKAAVSTVDWHPYYEYQLLSAGHDCGVRVWDIRKAAIGVRGQHVLHSQAILSLDWRQDHQHKADKATILSEHGLSTEQGLHQPRYQHPLQVSKQASTATAALGRAHDGPVLSARYTPCARNILTAGADGQVRLWQSESGRYEYGVRYEATCSLALPSRLQVSEEDGLLFLPSTANSTRDGNSKGEVAVLGVHDGRCVARLTGHVSTGINAVVYKKNTQQVVSAGRDTMILLYEAPQSTVDHDDADDGRVRVVLVDRSIAQAESSSGAGDPPGQQRERRLYVPPIVQQYREEAERARQKRQREGDTEERQINPILDRRNRQPRGDLDWNKIDELFK
ncbi:MAG: WD40 repeat domain-containing protein [Myxococcales bacterium]|nr:MAG: WD40 repeat domain-containing protein [Myxococcales bacterium]